MEDHFPGGHQLGPVLDVPVVQLGRHLVDLRRFRDRQPLGRDQVGTDGRIQGSDGQLHPIAGPDQVFTRLGQLDLEIEHVGLYGRPGLVSFPGHPQVLLQAVDGLLLNLHKCLGLQHPVVPTGNLINQFIAHRSQLEFIGLLAHLGHLDADDIGAAVVEPVFQSQGKARSCQWHPVRWDRTRASSCLGFSG